MAWPNDYPRSYYSKYEKVDIKSEWYDVYKLPNNVYAIVEPKHFQEVNSFLVIGEERAMMVDTGMDIENIRDVVDQLYKGEIAVVHTHFHFDHITGDKYFDKIYSFNEPHALKMLRRGATTEELAYQVQDEAFADGKTPSWFDRDSYHIPGIEPIPVEEGHIFDLGGRTLEVVHTPGHSDDGIMLFDEKNRMLFTGDTFYLAGIYTHFCSEFLGSSNFKMYLESLEKLQAYIPKLDWLVCSHNDILVEAGYLRTGYEAFKSIADGTAVPDDVDDVGLHGHGQDSELPLQFTFEGFTVYVNRKDYGKQKGKTMRKPKILISNCLLGIPCRYDGKSKLWEDLDAIEEKYELIGVCPEELGGLETPREKAEIYLGRVYTEDGFDVTYEYEYGADIALNIAKGHCVKCAVFKDRSPSCGCGQIYNGDFDGTLVEGDGVTTTLFKANGIEVIPASQAKERLLK